MRIVPNALLFALTALFHHMAVAQVSNVNPSINIISGEPYYIHEVLEGQQIEEIASAYYTKPKIIAESNPTIAAGLTPGMELKIPCSFESYDAMSRLDVSEKTKQTPRTESKAPESVATSTPAAQKEQQVTPIQEAVSLIDEEQEQETPATPDELPAPDSTEVAEGENPQESLEELSKSINESLAALRKIREQLEPPADTVADADSNEVSAPTARLPESSRPSELAFLEQVMDHYFAPDSSDSTLHLREFFFVTIDLQGLPGEVRDERTVTNANTDLLELSELQNIRYDAMRENGLVNTPQPLGLHLDARKHVYRLKIKRKRIRHYDTPRFVEHMKKSHPHFDLIRKAADSEGQRGKCRVIIYDGAMKVTLHQRFEYNPFAEVSGILKELHFTEIEEMVFQ